MYIIQFAKSTKKQIKKLRKNPKLWARFLRILEDLEQDPYSRRYKFEILRHQVRPTFSKRLSKADRVVYQVEEGQVVVTIIALLGHYNDH